jgi:hypothetical protein
MHFQFGEGINTWNTPFGFRTNLEGLRLLICGPANYFRSNAPPIMALMQSERMTISFSTTYKIINSEIPAFFEAGEPLFQAISLANDFGSDLNTANVTYRRRVDDLEMFRACHDWSETRTKFHQSKANNEVRTDQWQKDYFQGRDQSSREFPSDQMRNLKPLG